MVLRWANSRLTIPPWVRHFRIIQFIVLGIPLALLSLSFFSFLFLPIRLHFLQMYTFASQYRSQRYQAVLDSHPTGTQSLIPATVSRWTIQPAIVAIPYIGCSCLAVCPLLGGSKKGNSDGLETFVAPSANADSVTEWLLCSTPFLNAPRLEINNCLAFIGFLSIIWQGSHMIQPWECHMKTGTLNLYYSGVLRQWS